MANRKKCITSGIAVVMAGLLLLGGTLAWQSISQTALNEKEAVVNPGGRLHDDFNGKNKDVYVENFGEEDIFARVRLDEYFEIVMNKGNQAIEKKEIVTAGAVKEDPDTYVTHRFDRANQTDSYWVWKTGGQGIYMPTFNKNKDSLVADMNGTMNYQTETGASIPYGDYVEYKAGANKRADEIYDADSNSVDEVKADFDNLADYTEHIKVVKAVEHIAVPTLEGKGLISMAEWLALTEDAYSEEIQGNYWVYDTDGWVYWSSPIRKGTATAFLLDEICLKRPLDNSYYYAINVVAQFITADDLGREEDHTGFYADNETVTVSAITLLSKIGVHTDQTDTS